MCRYLSKNIDEVDSIQESIKTGDWTKVKFKIHSFKGVSLNLGFTQFGNIVLNLENVVAKEDVDEALFLCAELKKSFSKIYSSLYPVVCTDEITVKDGSENKRGDRSTNESISESDATDVLKVVEFMLLQGSTESIKRFSIIEESLSKIIEKDKLLKMRTALKSYDFDSALVYCREILTQLQEKKKK